MDLPLAVDAGSNPARCFALRLGACSHRLPVPAALKDELLTVDLLRRTFIDKEPDTNYVVLLSASDHDPPQTARRIHSGAHRGGLRYSRDRPCAPDWNAYLPCLVRFRRHDTIPRMEPTAPDAHY